MTWGGPSVHCGLRVRRHRRKKKKKKKREKRENKTSEKVTAADAEANASRRWPFCPAAALAASLQRGPPTHSLKVNSLGITTCTSCATAESPLQLCSIMARNRPCLACVGSSLFAVSACVFVFCASAQCKHPTCRLAYLTRHNHASTHPRRQGPELLGWQGNSRSRRLYMLDCARWRRGRETEIKSFSSVLDAELPASLRRILRRAIPRCRQSVYLIA